MADPRKDTEKTTETGPDTARRSAEPSLRAADAAAKADRTATDETERAARAAAADEMSATTETTMNAAADIARSSAESVQQTFQSSLDMAAQVTERSLDQFTRALGLPSREGEQTLKQVASDVSAIASCGTVIARGFQDISREWLSQAQQRLQKNLDSMNALLRVRSPQDAIVIQSDLARDNLEALLQQSRRVSERMVAVADEAMGEITAQTRTTAGPAQRAR